MTHWRSFVAASILLGGCAGDPDAVDPNDTGGSVDTDAGSSFPTDPHVDTYIPRSFPPTDPVRLVFLGDSITDGAGASSTSKQYVQLLQVNDSSAWPDADALDLETSFPGITEVIDVSFGGATISSLQSQQIPELESILSLPASGQTIFVVTIGGNDAQQALNPFADADSIMTTALSKFDTMTDWFLDPANFPDGAYLYAANLYEPSDGTGQSECFFGFNYSDRLSALEEMNEGVYQMGMDKGFAVVDMWRHFSGHGFNSADSGVFGYDADDPTNWFANDCIHPNDRGHHELRRLFHAAIEGHGLPIE